MSITNQTTLQKHNAFIDKYLGKRVDVDYFPKTAPFQCFDLAQAYFTEVLGLDYTIICKWSGGVKDFWEHFDELFDTNEWERVINEKDTVFGPGEVIIWNGNMGGGFGHIAIAVAGGTDRDLLVFEQNGVGGGQGIGGDACRIQKYQNWQNVYGCIRRKSDFVKIEKPTENPVLTKIEVASDPNIELYKTTIQTQKERIDTLEARILELENQIRPAPKIVETVQTPKTEKPDMAEVEKPTEKWSWSKFWVGLSRNGAIQAFLSAIITSLVSYLSAKIPELQPLQSQITLGLLGLFGIAVSSQSIQNASKFDKIKKL